MTTGQFDQPPLRIASASRPSGNEPNGKTRTNGAAARLAPSKPNGAHGLRPETSTTFMRDTDNQYRRCYCYGRSDNATVQQVEQVLTENVDDLIADIEQALSAGLSER